MKVGKYLTEKLMGLKDKYSFITNVRGRGLIMAIEFDSDIGQDVLMDCLNKGLLVNKMKPNGIRLVPPLIIGNNEVDRAIGILDRALYSCSSRFLPESGRNRFHGTVSQDSVLFPQKDAYRNISCFPSQKRTPSPPYPYHGEMIPVLLWKVHGKACRHQC